MRRMICWFSCGAASAVAAKLADELYGDKYDLELVYCDTLAYEHPDNKRFMDDVSRWVGREIKIIRSEKYTDIFDVFEKTKYLVGINGARCTVELKKRPRLLYQTPDDTHVFGFTHEEMGRAERYNAQNPEITIFPLIDKVITKKRCHEIIADAGIEQPAMYRLGYKNNNCVGCVKGQAGYWNKIRVDFPEAFARMAAMERKMNVAINKTYKWGKRTRVFLDELDPKAGLYSKESDFECGVICKTE